MLSFFFSSRRRHTRLQGDWSSDVCSSDLVPYGQSIAREDIGVAAGLHRHADFQADRVQDVALLPVGVVQQSQPRRAVRVIFDGHHARGDAGFIAAEIDDAVLALVTATAMPSGDFTVGIAPAGAFLGFSQRLFWAVLGQLALV